MKITLIKLNENTLEITLEKVVDVSNEFKDKEIFYDCDGISIVCRDCSISSIKQYKDILIRTMLKDITKNIIDANEDLCKLNRCYLNLVEKLI